MKKFPRIPLSILLSLAGLVFAVNYVVQSAKVPPRPQPLRAPATKPFPHSLAGTGIVESLQENISVTPYQGGKVVRVYVEEGQDVRQGDPLYAQDTESLQAQLKLAQQSLQGRRIALTRLQHSPRPEDVPPLQAAVRQAEANYRDALTQAERLEKVSDPRAISQDELARRRFAADAAKAALETAQANLKRTLAGAWAYDVEAAQSDIREVEAQIRQTQVLLDQAVVRAPVSGKVLQVNVRPGEYLPTNPTEAPVVVGMTQALQIRVDIDEINASRVTPNMQAVAFLRGNPKLQMPLRYHHIIPYMVPKRNLTGANTERVDVRVLQLIYNFEPPAFPVYVGQQVDVYLKESRPTQASRE